MMGIPHPRIHLKVFISSLVFTLVTLAIVKLSKNPQELRNLSKSKSNYNRTLNLTLSPIPSKDELRKIWIQKKIERLSSKFNGGQSDLEKPKYVPLKYVNDRVHIFYYAWYRSVEMDQVSRHWNDELVLNEDKFGLSKTDSLMGVRISFYPQEGFYSSRNESMIHMHMDQLKQCGIGVAVIYWKPPGFDDSPEEVMISLMNAAAKNGIKVAIHIAPYFNWSIEHLLQQLKNILNKYGTHEAFYSITRNHRKLPVFYIYDPFDLGSASWASILSPDGSLSIRNTEYDGVFIGLLADLSHRMEIKKSHFDGFYTYFAGNGYTYGSSWKNWQALSKFARDNKLLFIPCVAPGYAEPGGGSTNRPRHKGNYFEVGMRAAIDANPDIIAITSFNAWEEGSQIEPASPQRTGSYAYLDYKPHEPTYYLELAGWWIKWWSEKINSSAVRARDVVSYRILQNPQDPVKIHDNVRFVTSIIKYIKNIVDN